MCSAQIPVSSAKYWWKIHRSVCAGQRLRLRCRSPFMTGALCVLCTGTWSDWRRRFELITQNSLKSGSSRYNNQLKVSKKCYYKSALSRALWGTAENDISKTQSPTHIGTTHFTRTECSNYVVILYPCTNHTCACPFVWKWSGGRFEWDRSVGHGQDELYPVGHSHFFSPETGRPGVSKAWTKSLPASSIFHTNQQAVNRIACVGWRVQNTGRVVQGLRITVRGLGVKLQGQ